MHPARCAAVLACSFALSIADGARGAASEPVTGTSERVARGRYLVNAVAFCFDCHSPLLESDPPVPDPERLGAGDVLNDEKVVVAPNLTSDRRTGAGRWTDAQIARAIREGIGHDGRRLSPTMPSYLYSVLTDADVTAIVAYLRSLPPIERELPARRPGGPQERPERPPVAPAREASLADPVKRGEYLARIAMCIRCHTPLDRDGRPAANFDFGGGRRFERYKYWYSDIDPDPPRASANEPEAEHTGLVASANLTSHASGITHYDEQVFIKTLRTGKVAGIRPLSSAMMWMYFRHMTDEDLRAIFAYLRSLPPVAHRVSNVDPPTYCPVCGRRHGLGESNAAFAGTHAER